jgi:hypothetical protein
VPVRQIWRPPHLTRGDLPTTTLASSTVRRGSPIGRGNRFKTCPVRVRVPLAVLSTAGRRTPVRQIWRSERTRGGESVFGYRAEEPGGLLGSGRRGSRTPPSPDSSGGPVMWLDVMSLNAGSFWCGSPRKSSRIERTASASPRRARVFNRLTRSSSMPKSCLCKDHGAPQCATGLSRAAVGAITRRRAPAARYGSCTPGMRRRNGRQASAPPH